MSESNSNDIVYPTFQGRPIRLIGLSGKIGAGKTTLANYMCQRFGGGDDEGRLKKVSFAENLRRMVALWVGIDIERTRSAEDKAQLLPPGWGPMTVGELLQKFGTEVGREIHPDCWVLSLFNPSLYNPERSFWICDDMRFVNEAEGIKARGGLLVRLEGDPGRVRAEAGLTRNLAHASETGLDDYEGFDIVLNTDSEDYFNNVEALYNAIFDS